MNIQSFVNAAIVTPEEVFTGAVSIENGNITAVTQGNGLGGGPQHDCQGDYLLPGLIELHTDNLEKHLMPRPKVIWPSGESAFFAHDAQIIAAGITTVFDSLSVGEYHDKGRLAILNYAVEALHSCQDSGELRAEHFLHLRCEVADTRMANLFGPLADSPSLKLVSLMDHTPGQRQWRDSTAYRTYYSEICQWTDEEFQYVVADLQAQRDSCAPSNAALVMAFCRDRLLPMASHDDTLLEHVDEAVSNGISICEFPTTLEAAQHASKNGMLVLMGAPNVVRGTSHSGNISALEVAKAGYLGGLSSDYVPMSLLQAVFSLYQQNIMPLHAAVGLVSCNPAESVGLHDRGSIETGRRADLVQVRMVNGLPFVRAVWREGRQVF